MQRFIHIVVFMLMACVGAAQSVAVRSGVNFSSAVIKYDKDLYSEFFTVSPYFGYQVGADVGFAISNGISLQTALLYSTKGFKVADRISISGVQIDTKATLALHYIDLPVTLKFVRDFEKFDLFANVGGYASVGIAGRGIAEARAGTRVETIRRDVTWGKGEDDLKRMDYGLYLGGGAQLGKMQLGLAYAYGFVDVFENRNEGQTFKNSVLSLYLSYVLFSNKVI